MRVIRALALVTLACGAMLCTPQPVFACDCHDGGPVCEAFWKTPVVFVGRVEAIEALPTIGGGRADRERVRFRVTEALRGTAAREIDIFNYGTSCHHSFAMGELWVVYAFPQENGGGLTTHTCTRTAPLHDAGEDVAYGRAAPLLRADKGRVFGEVTYAHKSEDVTVPRARITLVSEGVAPMSARTDERGRYEILAPAGIYQLSAQLPPGMTLRFGERQIELSDNRGCARADMRVDYPGAITGRVLEASGQPVPNLTVELVAVDTGDYASFRLRAVTDASGRYAISGVEPGLYAPGVVVGHSDTAAGPEPLYVFGGRTTSKSAALRIEVEGGSQRNAGDLLLPVSTRIAQISGIVVDAAGRPAAGVRVRTKVASEGNFPWTTILTDSRGAFSFALAAGMSHRLVAEREEAAVKRADLTIEPSQVTSPLRLKLP